LLVFWVLMSRFGLPVIISLIVGVIVAAAGGITLTKFFCVDTHALEESSGTAHPGFSGAGDGGKAD